MLLVWVAYLQVFLHSYRRQLRPKIVVNRAAGTALEASCFVSNMSSESIYIECIIVTVRNGTADSFRRAVTDLEVLGKDDEARSDPRRRTLQGPLRPGEYTSIGTFQDLVDRVSRREQIAPLSETKPGSSVSIEVMVIADYSSEDLLIGARRSFAAKCNGGGWKITPEGAETEQVRSRRERRRMKDLFAEIND